jgi:3-methylfumaryl-CoA hydratase
MSRLVSRIRQYSTKPSVLQQWEKDITRKKLIENDVINPSQFNLMGNTLNHPVYRHNKLPEPGTVLPPAWHLAYFPPRVLETDLSSDGYEKDWSPPEPFVHRMWAGGELSWNKENPLRVGQAVRMESKIRDIQFRGGGRRGDSVFIWVDKDLHNEQGWSLTESRCWVYVKQTSPEKTEQMKKNESAPDLRKDLDQADFSLMLKPTPMTLFRFSALTFNSHLIHYDHVYSTTVEHQQGCLTHGPLSFTLMINQLYGHLDSSKKITSFNYRCLSPLVVNDEIKVCGKATGANEYDLWVLDKNGKVAVKGKATTE